jgi:hypothetical protein
MQPHTSGQGGAGRSLRTPHTKVPCLILRLDLRERETCSSLLHSWQCGNLDHDSMLGSVLTRRVERVEIAVLDLLVNHDRLECFQ